MSLTGNWNYPTSIRFGAGRIRELGEACRELGMQRPLLVTDQGMVTLPITEQALQELSRAGLGRQLYSGVQANPTGSCVQRGLERSGESPVTASGLRGRICPGRGQGHRAHGGADPSALGL